MVCVWRGVHIAPQHTTPQGALVGKELEGRASGQPAPASGCRTCRSLRRGGRSLPETDPPPAPHPPPRPAEHPLQPRSPRQDLTSRPNEAPLSETCRSAALRPPLSAAGRALATFCAPDSPLPPPLPRFPCCDIASTPMCSPWHRHPPSRPLPPPPPRAPPLRLFHYAARPACFLPPCCVSPPLALPAYSFLDL